MNVDAVILHLRTQAPFFRNAQTAESSIAGAAEYAAVEDQTWLPMPAAYVIPLEDEVTENLVQNGTRLVITESIQVVVVLDNKTDRRGQFAASQVDAAKAALFRALLGWRPDSSADNGGAPPAGTIFADRASLGLRYMGGGLLEPMDRARLFWAFRFGYDVLIDQLDDGWQPDAPPFVDIRADITSQETGETLSTLDVPLSQ